MKTSDKINAAGFAFVLLAVLAMAWVVTREDPLYRCVEERVVQVGLCRRSDGVVCQVFVEGGKTAWSSAKPGEMAKVCEEVEP